MNPNVVSEAGRIGRPFLGSLLIVTRPSHAGIPIAKERVHSFREEEVTLVFASRHVSVRTTEPRERFARTPNSRGYDCGESDPKARSDRPDSNFAHRVPQVCSRVQAMLMCSAEHLSVSGSPFAGDRSPPLPRTNAVAY